MNGIIPPTILTGEKGPHLIVRFFFGGAIKRHSKAKGFVKPSIPIFSVFFNHKTAAEPKIWNQLWGRKVVDAKGAIKKTQWVG